MGKGKRLPNQLPAHYRAAFPNIKAHKVTSEDVTTYNCVAFAAGDPTRWWEDLRIPEPGFYWPPGVHSDDDVGSIAALKRCFAKLGYEECATAEAERGYTKVALYAKTQDDYQHVAIQDESGKWFSKLGDGYDIWHETAQCVSGPLYGSVILFSSRQVSIGRRRPRCLR